MFVIVMFSVFSGLCAGGEVSAFSIVNIPVSILLGAAVGAVCGVLMALLFRKLHMRDSWLLHGSCWTARKRPGKK